MKSPREIIEDIRKTRFGIGLNLDNVSEEVKKYIDESQKFKEDAARLVSNLYTEKPHFILELIQNAEDNSYAEGVTPKLKFIIQENQLVIQNNEEGFKEENVSAICAIGKTTKKDKRSGYIGEMGIGFKSVFMVSSEPAVFSNGFQFKFCYKEDDPVTIVIPNWIDEVPDSINKKETNIVLPLKDEVKKELSRLAKIEPNLLLFLNKLKRIEIENQIEGKLEVIQRNDINGKIEICHQEGKTLWKIVKNTGPIPIPDYIKEEKRKGIKETDIRLAFLLNSDGTGNSSADQKLFAFLPVRSYGFKFIIQGDFLLPPSREDIHKDRKWNEFLRDQIPPIFENAVNSFKEDENLKRTFFNFIPLKEEIQDPFFLPVVEKIHQLMAENECILTDSGAWRRPREVLMAEPTIRELIPNSDLKDLLNVEFISNEFKAKKEILRALGVKEFQLSHLYKVLSNSDFVQKQADEWFAKLYSFLNDQKVEEEDKDAISNLRIIKLGDGSLTSISEGTIFFPLAKKEEYGFEKEIRIVKSEILKGKDAKSAEEFLRGIGVKTASPFEIIENHILPIYESSDEKENWACKGEKILLGYVRFIKDNLDDYEKESDKKLNSAKKSWEQKEDPLKRLKQSILLKCRNNRFEHPNNIFLPKIYGNKNNLETLFEGIEGIMFLDKDYLLETIKKYSGKRKARKKKTDITKEREKEINEWRDFFIKLGVNEGFKINETNESYLTWEDKQKLRGQDRCTYENITDYELIPLGEVLKKLAEAPSKEKLKLLINLLESQWGKLSKYLKLKYKWQYYSWNINYADSSWLHLLKTTPWLLTTKGTLSKPYEAFLNKKEIRELLGEDVPYLVIDIKNEELIKALGINSEANISGVLNYLHGLIEKKCSDISLFTKLYSFLNNKFKDDPKSVKEAFETRKIIYIPETPQLYFKSSEVFWKDLSEIFGENRGYLERHYKDLKDFFVNKLEIQQKPDPKNYADVLLDLSKKQQISKEDEKVILKIYKELNENLDPEKVESVISEEQWWSEFLLKPIFWTDKREFWFNNNDIFINDNEEFYEIFKEYSDIAFLKLPRNYHPKLQYFIKSAGIQLLSNALNYNLRIGEAKESKELTVKTRKFIPYILRYIYQLENKEYEKLKEKGKLAQLKNITCFVVEELMVEYELNRIHVSIPKSIIIYGGNLYVKEKDSIDADHLAVELSKLFGNVRGIDDFLTLLFTKKTSERIENWLKLKGIQDLPEDEKEYLEINTSSEGIKEQEGTEEKSESEGGEREEEEWQPICAPENAQGTFEEFKGKEKEEYKVSEKKKEDQNSQYKVDREKWPPPEISPEPTKDKKAIGRWGEEYVFSELKKKYGDKYPDGQIEESGGIFIIKINGKEIAKVEWLNYETDQQKGYDIIIIENGAKEYIEVKATKTGSKEFFEVTRKEWENMKEKGDSYHIYRVYNAGEKEPKIVDIKNPCQKWANGELEAYPVRIHI